MLAVVQVTVERLEQVAAEHPILLARLIQAGAAAVELTPVAVMAVREL
jgi:hypothetical protein